MMPGSGSRGIVIHAVDRSIAHRPVRGVQAQAVRWGFARGRTVILCTVPHKEWRLAKFGARRGTPMQIENRPFTAYKEVVWACFRARWKEMTGRDCPVE